MEAQVSIWCAGSSEKVYAAVTSVHCPECGKVVDVTKQGHIKPHVESKISEPAKK
jgi:hypothetical protein